jgi:hypothetical protein
MTKGLAFAPRPASYNSSSVNGKGSKENAGQCGIDEGKLCIQVGVLPYTVVARVLAQARPPPLHTLTDTAT